MTDTRDSFEKWCISTGCTTASMEKFQYGEDLYVFPQMQAKWEAWQAALQAGAVDGARMDFLESLAVADIDEKAITRLVIFNLWRGTTYDDLRTAIDNAQATEPSND
jgi:hypothetical protein